MSKYNKVYIKFDMDNPLHSIAWETLRNKGNGKHKSYTETILAALKSYNDKLNHLADDPYFETRQKEDEFITNMLQLMKNKLEQEFPDFLISCIATLAVKNLGTNGNNSSEVEKSPEESTDIDWDFLGED